MNGYDNTHGESLYVERNRRNANEIRLPLKNLLKQFVLKLISKVRGKNG